MSGRRRKGGSASDFDGGAQAAGRIRRPTTKGITKTATLIDAPMAITSGGEILVGATHLDLGADLLAIVRSIVEQGLPVFIGIAVPAGALRAELLKGIEDGLADVVGRLGPRLQRRGPR